MEIQKIVRNPVTRRSGANLYIRSQKALIPDNREWPLESCWNQVTDSETPTLSHTAQTIRSRTEVRATDFF